MTKEDMKKLARLLTILTNSKADYGYLHQEENTLIRIYNKPVGDIQEFLDFKPKGSPPVEGFDLVFADTCVHILSHAIENIVKPALAEAERFLQQYQEDS